MDTHMYETSLAWSGSTGSGYRDYDRAHRVGMGEAAHLDLSADPAFRGDSALANPEQLLLAAASSCQLLSFLAVAALARVDVVSYTDAARATMPSDTFPVRITKIALNPAITVQGSDAATVQDLMRKAHEQCYIANTLTAEMTIDATVTVIDG